MDANTIFHNRYKLKKLLGRGQFSEVWLAEDIATKVRFALKIYAPATGLDDNGVQMLSREFALLANANHENLLKPTYFDVCDRKPYLVLPYCEQGSSLKLVGKMKEDEAWRFIHDVAAGLAYLHSYKPDAIIHQDIKPDNIMIGPNGQYMITDFGVSTHSKSALRKSIGVKFDRSGTIAYMGPERFSDNNIPIKASDIWSLGATVYEMITGYAPFGEHGGLLQTQKATVPDIKGDFSPDLRLAIRSCMHFHPWDRPTAETLVKWATNKKYERGNPTGAMVSKRKPAIPSFVIPAAIAVGVLILAVVLKISFSSHRPSPDDQTPSIAVQTLYQKTVDDAQQKIALGDTIGARELIETVSDYDQMYGEFDSKFNEHHRLELELQQVKTLSEETNSQK